MRYILASAVFFEKYTEIDYSDPYTAHMSAYIRDDLKR